MSSAHGSVEPASPKHSPPLAPNSHLPLQTSEKTPHSRRSGHSTSCAEPGTGSRERWMVWAFQTFQGRGQENCHLLLLEHRDSSFLLTQTGNLGALGFSSLADTTVSPCRQHQDTSQDFPCPHFGMESSLWSHSRSRPGDNTTAQLSLLGSLSLCAFPAPLEPGSALGAGTEHGEAPKLVSFMTAFVWLQKEPVNTSGIVLP